MKLYHGTSTKYLDRIVETGLDPKTSCYDHVCLSSDPTLSWHFAEEMARWEKAEPVLLEIDGGSLDDASFTHEMGWIGNSLEDEDGAACLRGTPFEMLETYKVIGYLKTIEPSSFKNIDPNSVLENSDPLI